MKTTTIYRSIVQSVLTYGAEVWDVSAKNKNKLLSTEMDYLRTSCRLRRVDRGRNETIRNMMGMERDIVDEAQRFGMDTRLEWMCERMCGISLIKHF